MFSMRVCCGISLALIIVVGGCSSDNTAARVAQFNKSNIQKASNLYSLYYRAKSSSGPKDAAALKEFASKDVALEQLQLMQIDPKNVDAIFVSERDGKALKVKPNVPSNPFAPGAVVFEDTGVNGQRQVGFTNSTVQEVNDAKYKELWDGKDTSGGASTEATKAGG
jgi:hypothetical protein